MAMANAVSARGAWHRAHTVARSRSLAQDIVLDRETDGEDRGRGCQRSTKEQHGHAIDVTREAVFCHDAAAKHKAGKPGKEAHEAQRKGERGPVAHLVLFVPQALDVLLVVLVRNVEH
jgi:hypothetical protein